MSNGGLTEGKAKRPNPYDGNMKEADSLAGELKREKFADGGPAGKKGAIMAIVAKLAKKPSEMGEAMKEEGEGMESEGEDMMGEAKMSAASEVMDALKGGDVKAFAGALENFMKCCGEYED